MKKLTNLMIRDCTSQGSEICHELADALYQHQAAMAKDPLHKETLGNMRYENRLKPSFDSADEKQLLVAFDGEKPVGYIFTAAEEVTEESRRQLPPWGEGAGFYPRLAEEPSTGRRSWKSLYPARIPGNRSGRCPDHQGYGVGCVPCPAPAICL